MNWLTERTLLGGIVTIFTLALFSIIVWRGIGGDLTLGVIVGHTAAWTEMVVYFYFRKKLEG